MKSNNLFELVNNNTIKDEVDNYINDFPYADKKFDSNEFNDFNNHDDLPKNNYHTDTQKITCNCKDWEKSRKQYDKYDPRRLCKHLISQLTDEEINKYFTYYKESIYFYKDRNKGFKRDIVCLKEFNECELKILMGDDWNDVFDKNGKRYGYKFYYKEKDHAWAKNEKPVGYQYIQSFFENIEVLSMPLTQKEKIELINYLNSKESENFEIDIDKGDSYILPPSVLHYDVNYDSELDSLPDNEVDLLYVTPEYVKVDFWDIDSVYFKRLEPSSA